MPLSPVNSLNDANSMNTKVEPTNFRLPPSYAEDDRVANAITLRGPLSDQSELRQHLGEQRNDRFQSGVTSGTLDAIRERVKSIQLAAAAGNPESGTKPLIPMDGNVTYGLSSQFPLATERASTETPMQGGVLPMDEKALSGLQSRMQRLKNGSIEPL